MISTEMHTAVPAVYFFALHDGKKKMYIQELKEVSKPVFMLELLHSLKPCVFPPNTEVDTFSLFSYKNP